MLSAGALELRFLHGLGECSGCGLRVEWVMKVEQDLYKDSSGRHFGGCIGTRAVGAGRSISRLLDYFGGEMARW